MKAKFAHVHVEQRTSKYIVGMSDDFLKIEGVSYDLPS